MSAVLAQSQQQPRFLRRTTLKQNEYNRNFRMLDEETLCALTSPEADAVTPLMSKIYLRLLQAPDHCCRGERELHFEGEVREGKRTKAWDQLCRHLRVSSETAQKALQWMHEQGIIGYSAFKNRVGIFIFLNRAASSIGIRHPNGSQKILNFPPASESERHASPSDTAFNDSFGSKDGLDTDLIPSAPKNGANTTQVDKTISESDSALDTRTSPPIKQEGREVAPLSLPSITITVDEIVERLKRELEPSVKAAAAQAAMNASARETAQTRKWFEERALPKAVRVAQHETYGLFKKLGALDERSNRMRSELQVGRAVESYESQTPRSLTPAEITDTAETCIALLETQGKSIEVTLSEISAEAGGWLLAEDAPRVRDRAQSLLSARENRR